jgi:hypothetical protein
MSNENIKEYGRKTRFEAIGNFNEPIGKKSFAFKLPESYEKKLKALSQKDRVLLVRESIINALDNYYEKSNA